MENDKRLSEIVTDLKSSDTAFPLLKELLTILNTADFPTKEKSQSAILDYFEGLRKTSSLEVIGILIQSLRSEYLTGTKEAEFLDLTLKGHKLLLEDEKNPIRNVYKNLIRTFSSAYLFDGTIRRCPKCKSTNVFEGENSMFEFTDMNCKDCGYQHLADDYSLEDWYPVE